MQFTLFESWALFLLMTTRSVLVESLDAVVKDNGKSLDDVFKALKDALTGAPFNLNPGKIARAKWEPLWTTAPGVKAAKIDRSTVSVAAVFADTIGPYDIPPCPDAPTQAALFTKLTS